MRPVFSLFLTLSLLPACGPTTEEECSETEKITGYRDEDGDGHGDPATQTQVCEVGVAGWVPTGLDCDDTRSTVSPDQIEECDGVDNDCDNAVDEGLRGVTYYADQDLDGYGHPDLTAEACSPPPGYVENSSDCDDGDPLSFPGSDEFCDGEDNDCDGLVDDADPDIEPSSQPWWYLDGDGDSYGDPDTGIQRCDAPGPNAVDNADDCNDSSVGISPAATEVCDGIDNDCDGLIDDSDPTLTGALQTWYYDFDGDGLGDPGMPFQSCNQPWFYVGDASDCDDSNEFILDSTSTFWRIDADGDTYGDPLIPSVGPDCTSPGTGYTPEGVGDDCNDAVAAINPGATEICDGLDNDCDSLLDDLDDSLDLNSTLTFYADVDGDGFGDPTAPTEACTQPPNTVTDFTDCDDSDFDINLGALEICNGGIDDDCNGLADAADPNLDPLSAPNWYVDFDGDGFGCAEADCGVTISCTQPAGLVSNDVDCDDNDEYILGDVDWLDDADGDGFGAGAVLASGCYQPDPDAVPDLGPQDCNDSDPLTYPGADEVCGDGLDQDCNGPDQTCPPDTCAQAGLAVPLTTDTRYVDDLGTYVNDVSFANFNSCTGHPTNGGDAIIPVQISPGDHFSAWMVGSADASLYLLDTCTAPNPATNCSVGGDNVGSGGVESVFYTNLTAITQTRYLVVDCNGACSGYELELDFDAPGLSDTCGVVGNAQPMITGGYSLHSSLTGFADDSDLGALGCTGIESGGGDAFIPLDLLPGETLSVDDYTQTLDDSSVYLVTSCVDTFGTCLVGSDNNGAGQSETLQYTNGGGVTERLYLTLDCYLPSCREFGAKIAIE